MDPPAQILLASCAVEKSIRQRVQRRVDRLHSTALIQAYGPADDANVCSPPCTGFGPCAVGFPDFSLVSEQDGSLTVFC